MGGGWGWEGGGVTWLCVTVTLYLDGEALAFNKAQVNKQTDFIRQEGPGRFQLRQFGSIPTAGVDFQLISSVSAGRQPEMSVSA